MTTNQTVPKTNILGHVIKADQQCFAILASTRGATFILTNLEPFEEGNDFSENSWMNLEEVGGGALTTYAVISEDIATAMAKRAHHQTPWGGKKGLLRHTMMMLRMGAGATRDNQPKLPNFSLSD